MARRRTSLFNVRGLVVFGFLNAVVLATAQNPGPIQVRSWYLTNNFACFSDGTMTNCGPHLGMDEDTGNGTFPSGFVQVSDGVSRIWIAPEISPLNTDYSASVWTLNIGGSGTVTGLTWTVGLWDGSTSTFTAADGPETIVTEPGRSTFAPTGAFVVPGRRLLAFRATGTSGDGAPSFFDVYDELDGNSPTSLTVAGEPSDEAPPEIVLNDADKIACDNTGAPLQSSCGRKWHARYDGTFSGPDWGADVVVSPDGSRVFVTGGSEGVPPRQNDFATIAYDANTGATLWAARLDGVANSEDQAVAAVTSPDGKHLYVGGSACVAKGALFCTNLNYLLVSYDAATGGEEWRVGYAGPAGGEDSPTQLAISSDGAVVIVTGQSWGGASNDYATVAYDALTGAERWVTRYDGPGQGTDAAQAVKISSDGAAAYVTGTSKSASDGSDFATISYDTATGEIRWMARFDGTAHADDFAVSLAMAPNGNVVYVTGSANGGSSGRDYAVVAYSTFTGEAVWTQIHNGQWNGDDWPSAIAVSPDGTRVFVAGREDENALASEAATVALAADSGTNLWVSRYSAGKHQTQPQDLATTPDGTGVVVALTSLSRFAYSSADYVTISYGANLGEARWSGRYNGPAKDDDDSAALALNPDGTAVFVTGISAGYRTAATVSDWDVATVAYSLPAPPMVVSRRNHGNAGPFDIDLPLTGAAANECRSGGASGSYQMIFTFIVPVTASGAFASPGTGNTAEVDGPPVRSVDGKEITVNLKNVGNAQTIMVTLLGINDGTNTSDVAVQMALLVGDTTGNGAVNSSDISQTKSQSGQTVSAANFRQDVTVNGSINSSDISLVKSNSGTALP